jgi:hypothetical protein
MCSNCALNDKSMGFGRNIVYDVLINRGYGAIEDFYWYGCKWGFSKWPPIRTGSDKYIDRKWLNHLYSYYI